MNNPKCLHCAVSDLITSKFSDTTSKQVILRLSEVIGDIINNTHSHKDRAELYDYWSETLCEIMHDIEEGNYK